MIHAICLAMVLVLTECLAFGPLNSIMIGAGDRTHRDFGWNIQG